MAFGASIGVRSYLSRWFLAHLRQMATREEAYLRSILEKYLAYKRRVPMFTW